MSLINDALKRAKQAQQENPPPTPPLQFRPVEPAQEGHPRPPLFIVGAVLGLIVIVGLGGLLLWAVTQKQEASLQVEARSLGEVAPAESRTTPPANAADAGRTTPPVSSPEEAQTNSLPATAVEPPQVPELKLQGIFFNPRRPSAVVGGRTVYVGDKVSGFRVLAITPLSVTLGNSEKTNVLSLSE